MQADSAAQAQRFAAQTGGTVQDHLAEIDMAAISYDERVPRGSQIIEPVIEYRALTNDPLFTNQWSLPRIGAPVAWQSATGTNIKIAIIDSGISAHEDLPAAQILAGWDFIDSDNDPNDTYGHGTFIAGQLIATPDNGIGIAGAAPGAQVIPIKVLASNGRGSSANIAAGIIEAANQGAQVINLSIGSTTYSQVIHDALVYARERGAINVCASGNDNTSTLAWPAADPECIAVGATTTQNTRAIYSNYGPGLGFVAPGSDILSLGYGGTYIMMSGTSMAAPYVAAASALLLQQGVTPSNIRQELRTRAHDLDVAGYDTQTGYGLVQLAPGDLGQTIPAIDESSDENASEDTALRPFSCPVSTLKLRPYQSRRIDFHRICTSNDFLVEQASRSSLTNTTAYVHAVKFTARNLVGTDRVRVRLSDGERAVLATVNITVIPARRHTVLRLSIKGRLCGRSVARPCTVKASTVMPLIISRAHAQQRLVMETLTVNDQWRSYSMQRKPSLAQRLWRAKVPRHSGIFRVHVKQSKTAPKPLFIRVLR